MSTTLSIGDMVLDVQSRIPMGLGSPYIILRLNETFRWIAQQESFMWQLRKTTVAVDPATVDFPLPDDADPGDIMSLYGVDFKTEIPFIPFQRFSGQMYFSSPIPASAPFSAWTIVSPAPPAQPGLYMGKLAPDTPLLNPVKLNLFYHASAQPVTDPNLFFPSPDEFDSLIVDLTEGEIKRRYHIGGFEQVQQKAIEGVKKLMDTYKSSKSYIQGMADQAARTQEAQLKRAE